MSKHFHITAFALAIGLAPLVANADTIATVNGQSVTSEEMHDFLQDREVDPAKLTAKQRSQVIDQMVARELLYQDSLAKKLPESPEIQTQLQRLRRELLIGADIQAALKANPVTDAEIKQEYDQRAPGLRQPEYKARHILVKTKKEAEAVIKQLEKGADFAKLAKEKSTGPSGKEGGELGWFSAERMVPPFSKAVQNMKKGTFTKEPVKTQFGWHVIKLEDTRIAEPPPLEALKPQLKKLLQKRHVAEYIEGLRKKAKVEVK